MNFCEEKQEEGVAAESYDVFFCCCFSVLREGYHLKQMMTSTYYDAPAPTVLAIDNGTLYFFSFS